MDEIKLNTHLDWLDERRFFFPHQGAMPMEQTRKILTKTTKEFASLPLLITKALRLKPVEIQ